MGHMEILTGVERRRRWSEDDKIRILREASEPGSSIADVARRHEVSRSQIYQWRRALRVGQLRSEDMAMIDFLPVEVSDAQPKHEASSEARPVSVMISLRGGRTLRLPSSLASSEIKRLIAAVESA